MFSNRKKNNLEELRRNNEILGKIVKTAADNGPVYEVNCGEIEASRKQMEADINQVAGNLQVTRDIVGQNIRMENALCEELRTTSWAMEQSEQEYREIVNQLHRQTELFLGLVEQNKHFTSPSKYLSETPAFLNSWNQESQRMVEQMQEDGQKMAAFGERLEEKEYSDVWKRYTLGYRNAADTLLQHIKSADQKIAKLEEQTKYLVALLKENNISMGKLLKENQTTVRMVEKSSIRPYSGDVLAWREQILGVRNGEDEVLKAQERNQLQMEDISAEIRTQRKTAAEISNELIPMFSDAKDAVQ